MSKSVLKLTVLILSLVSLRGTSIAVEKPDRGPAFDKADKNLVWHQHLDAAFEEARQRKKSILVRAGADWCHWCHKLQAELEDPDVQQELANWVLVYIDTDENPDDARRLNIGPIPALRILSAGGRTRSSRDGFVPAEKLLDWLKQSADTGANDIDEELTSTRKLTSDVVTRLVKHLGNRETVVREAVIRRLASDQQLARNEVIRALGQGNLATRLSSLEILASWKAPLAELDPWQPETFTADRLKVLDEWSAALPEDSPDESAAVEPLSPERIDQVRAEISKLGTADLDEAEAIISRLSRLSRSLMPEVRDQSRQAATDKLRERLDWLRFRLASADALDLKWPGGLMRLASTDARVRRAATQELAKLASKGDESLLAELLLHPDSLMRETSLRALHAVGGSRANDELARLLDDPEPNIRAAVLKLWSEKPSLKVTGRIADYVATEQDADLVVHAVRLLRAIRGQDAVDCLIGQLSHSSWQVRAEAIEAIGEIVSDDTRHQSNPSGASPADKRTAYAAITKTLADADGYVVSRAIQALNYSVDEQAVQPLLSAVDQHPDLAEKIGEALITADYARGSAALRTWLRHQDERLRAAGLKTLAHRNAFMDDDDIAALFRDASEFVRIAAAETVWKHCDDQRLQAAQSDWHKVVEDELIQEPRPATGFFGGLVGLFGGRRPAPKQVTPKRNETDESEQATSPQDKWLADFRQGAHRPKWLQSVIDPLKEMLTAPSQRERVTAGLALVPLGHDDDAIPVLLDVAKTNRGLSTELSKVLRWLPFEQRAKHFDELYALSRDPQERSTLFEELTVYKDSRTTELLWGMLKGQNVDGPLAQTIVKAMAGNPQDRMQQDLESATEEDPKEGLLKRIREGSEWQQRAAMAFLLSNEATAAVDAAQSIYENDALSPGLRRDAFRVVLSGSPPREAAERAAKALMSHDAIAALPSLTYLALGEDHVLKNDDGTFHMKVEADVIHLRQFSQESPPWIPTKLKAADIRPFLQHEFVDVRAQAASVLAMLGDTSQIELIVQRWRRADQNNSAAWRKLVYYAIADADDAKYFPILDEIYQAISQQSNDLREFYWTIRSMHGPDVLQLRKRIRDDVGMSQLLQRQF